MHGEVCASVGDVSALDRLRKGKRGNDNDGSAQNSDVHCKRSIRGHAPVQKNNSKEEISTLLDLVEGNEPLGANMWAKFIINIKSGQEGLDIQNGLLKW